jgi:hypothetical protein
MGKQPDGTLTNTMSAMFLCNMMLSAFFDSAPAGIARSKEKISAEKIKDILPPWHSIRVIILPPEKS